MTKSTMENRNHNLKNTLVLVIFFVGSLTMITVGLNAATEPAEAGFPIDNFSVTDATINPSGNNVKVIGTLKCTEGETSEVEVTVRQDNVEATGQTHERCLGEDTTLHWTIQAATRGPESLKEDSAQVSVEARTFAKGKQTDEIAWVADVELERQ